MEIEKLILRSFACIWLLGNDNFGTKDLKRCKLSYYALKLACCAMTPGSEFLGEYSGE